jgi:hypothetical protein
MTQPTSKEIVAALREYARIDAFRDAATFTAAANEIEAALAQSDAYLRRLNEVAAERDAALGNNQPTSQQVGTAHEPCALPTEARDVIEAFLQQGDFSTPHWLGDKARAFLARGLMTRQEAERFIGLTPPLGEDLAVAELQNIATAERFNRRLFDHDEQFADWAQSRARHTLARITALTKGGEQP